MWVNFLIAALCYFSVRLGAVLRTPRQRAWAHASLALSVVLFLAMLVTLGPFNSVTVMSGVSVCLVSIVCVMMHHMRRREPELT